MIISIDPGVSNCGISRVSFDGKHVSVHTSENIKGSIKLRDGLETVAEDHDDRTAKVLRICNYIEDVLSKHPDIKTIVLEAPFIHPGRPMAFGALLEVLNAIKYRLSIETQIKNIVIAPKLIKKIFYGNGKANKNEMLKALEDKIKKGYVILDEGVNIEDLTEHQIDSIAVGYTYITHSQGVIHEETN